MSLQACGKLSFLWSPSGGKPRQQVLTKKNSNCPQADRGRWVQVTARDVSDAQGHAQDAQAQSQRNAQKANSQRGESGGKHGFGAADQDPPEASGKFGTILFHVVLQGKP
jgi:hypothetical protein